MMQQDWLIIHYWLGPYNITWNLSSIGWWFQWLMSGVQAEITRFDASVVSFPPARWGFLDFNKGATIDVLFPWVDWLIEEFVYPSNNRWMMIDGMPLYFYQKDIIGFNSFSFSSFIPSSSCCASVRAMQRAQILYGMLWSAAGPEQT